MPIRRLRLLTAAAATVLLLCGLHYYEINTLTARTTAQQRHARTEPLPQQHAAGAVPLPSSSLPPPPPSQLAARSDPLTQSRRAAIVEAFVHSWRGYERHAWGYDELRPVSNKPNDAWGGFAVTMIDALDTAYLMNLTAEFGRATDWLAAHLVVDRDHYVSVFEHTIRVFGGLLSAFDLSGDERLLRLAVAAATRLLPAFKESDGLPSAQVNTRSGERRSHGWAPGKILSEAGSVQLEFMRLYTILSVRMMPSARARPTLAHHGTMRRPRLAVALAGPIRRRARSYALIVCVGGARAW